MVTSMGRLASIHWPGPRALRADEPLLGRDKEFARLLRAVRGGYHVIEVTGVTGVGKSSFLNHARGYMGEHDHLPLIPGDKSWPGWGALLEAAASRPRSTPSELAAAVYAAAVGAEPEESAEEALSRLTQDGPVVVVLDQFEELLRYKTGVGLELLALVGRTARDLEITHIVSARAEYSHYFAALEQASTQIYPVTLNEITDPQSLADIVRVPVELGGAGIDDAVVHSIVGWWTEARRESGEGESVSGSGGGVGLLHLQALLWLIGQWIAANECRDSSLFDSKMLKAFLDDQNPELQQQPSLLASAALVQWVTHLEARLTELPRQSWKVGPVLMVARVARFMSTSGYKIPQSLSSLVGLALRDELGSAGSRPHGASGSDAIAEYRKKKLLGSGFGYGSGSVASTMIDALRAGLEFLAGPDGNVLRGFAVSEAGEKADPIYELVHDGMGTPLSIWADRVLDDAPAVVEVITARAGLRLTRRAELDETPGGKIVADFCPKTFGIDGSTGVLNPRWQTVSLSVDGKGEPVAQLSRLVWLGNAVEGVIFEDVEFVDCLFTGSAFTNCRFINVKFTRCDLSGVLMYKCGFDDVEVQGVRQESKDVVLTLDGCIATSAFTIKGFPERTSLFLLKAEGGPWQAHSSSPRHLVVSCGSTTVPISLELQDCTIRHLSLEGDLMPKLSGHSNNILAAWNPWALDLTALK